MTTVWVERDDNGDIVAIYRRPRKAGLEEIDDSQIPPAPSPTDNEIKSAIEAGNINRLLFELNFDQENRIRALESKAMITKAQYRNALVTRWKAL